MYPAQTDYVTTAQHAERSGKHAEARAHLETALHTKNFAVDGALHTRAAILRWIGNTYRAEGRLEDASNCYQASLAVAEADGSELDIAHALNWLAIVAQDRGDFEEAGKLYVRARSLAESANDRRLVAMIGQNLGSIAIIKGDFPRAISNYRRSLSTYRALNDDESVARSLNNLGLLYMELRRWEDAESCFTEGATIGDRIGDTVARAMIEVNRVELAYQQGDIESALRVCARAQQFASCADHQVALGEVYMWYGVLYRATERLELAETYLDAAAEQASKSSNLLLAAEVERERARLYIAQDRNHAALHALNEAQKTFSRVHAERLLKDIDRILHDLQQTFIRVVERWAESIEQKDRYTAGHCERVAAHATLIARAAGYDEQTIVWLRMGAFLHDVGKTGIPASILNKPGPLSAAERAMMERHTVIGVELLSGVQFPWDITGMVRSHHERWDGTGYPDKLAGADIPLPARILCLADVYDALTTTRSYRRAYTPEEAILVMRKEVGHAFDPALWPLFEQVLTTQEKGAAAA